MTLHVYDSAPELASHMARQFENRLRTLQVDTKTPSVVLTGGSIATAMYRELGADALNWSRIAFYWGDERFVPRDHPQSNAWQARDAFLERVAAQQIHAMPASDAGMSIATAASQYAATLPAEGFDLTLLGIGPDGHIASLFPHHRSLAVTTADVIAEVESPKPPPQRLSLSLPALNRSTAVWFVAAGAEKAEAVRLARSSRNIAATPASGVRGTVETLWFLDAAAATQIADD